MESFDSRDLLKEKCERIIKVLEVHLSPWKLQLPKLITDNAFIY